MLSSMLPGAKLGFLFLNLKDVRYCTSNIFTFLFSNFNYVNLVNIYNSLFLLEIGGLLSTVVDPNRY